MKTSVVERIANYIYGYCTVKVSGYPERALSAMLESGINYWDLRREDDCIILSLPQRQLKSLKRLLGEHSCTIVQVVMRGAMSSAKRHVRPGIIVGALIFCAVLWASTCFIWDISVSGNTSMTDWEVIDSFKEYGVKYGAFIPSLSFEKICIDYVTDSDDIAWASVNMSGTRADIVVRERNDGGGAWESDTPSNLIAAEDGQIRRFCVWSGEACIHLGDVVRKGDLLVSGINDIVNKQSGEVLGYALDRSFGNVYAEVYREYTVDVPLEYEVKTYTGKEFTEKSYKFFTKGVKSFSNSRKIDGFYDKIENEDRVMLFDILKLPIFRTTCVYKEYKSEKTLLSEEQASELAEAKMMKLLSEELVGCELEKRTFNGNLENGVYTLKCSVYCIADIAKEVGIGNGAEDSNDRQYSADN